MNPLLATDISAIAGFFFAAGAILLIWGWEQKTPRMYNDPQPEDQWFSRILGRILLLIGGLLIILNMILA